MNPADPSGPLVVTAGEPAGIGPDLCIAVANSDDAPDIVVLGDADMLQDRANSLNVPISIVPYQAGQPAFAGKLRVLTQALPAPVVCGKPDPRNSPALLRGLERAIRGCESGEFAALVTAPLQKSVIIEAGIDFSGHTEFLAARTGASTPVMLLASKDLRVALASTHLPLRDVPDYLTTDRIIAVLTVLDHDLKLRFGIKHPRILVCGLNPHAGENRHLGTEDDDIIRPAIEQCRSRGMQVEGPLPADTAFTPVVGKSDAILAMYHDQGLPVIKYAGFGHAVNVTLGLPIIRTSVDHGTALSLAGSGKADPGSLIAAVALARTLAMRK